MPRKIICLSISSLVVLGIACFFLNNALNKATAQSFASRSSTTLKERFWAENWIQISFSPTPGMYDAELDMTPFEIYVNTQIALIKSPMVLQSVVENPTIARLPNIQKQVDPIQWISDQLKIEGALSANRRGEIFIVSMNSTDPKEAELIVNAVVDSFISYSQIEMMQQDQILQKSLTEAKSRHEGAILELQKFIPGNLNDPNAQNAQTALSLAQVEREMRALDHINDRLTRLEISRGCGARVRVLQRAKSQNRLQVPDSFQGTQFEHRR